GVRRTVHSPSFGGVGAGPGYRPSFAGTLEEAWNPPETFDDFRILRPLGRGGMGRVFLGRDETLDRPVALKFVSSAFPSRVERDRFLLEARAIARLSHPNVVAVFRVGEVDDRPYLAYE